MYSLSTPPPQDLSQSLRCDKAIQRSIIHSENLGTQTSSTCVTKKKTEHAVVLTVNLTLKKKYNTKYDKFNEVQTE